MFHKKGGALMAAKKANPAAEVARDDMDTDTFDTIMQTGLDEARAGHSRPASEVFIDLKRGL